ncbi:hypothetical protein YC2023_103684 [Brassica napus]
MSQQINTIKVWSRNRGPTGRRAAKEQVNERPVRSTVTVREEWESQALLAIEEKCKVSEEALFLLMASPDVVATFCCVMGIVRGHMVRRQAVATFCCVMGIVKLQALARGREIRRSDIGIEVHSKCRLNQEDKFLKTLLLIHILT